jgi:hypothetical protein
MLSWVHALERERSTVYWSQDGEDWTQIDKATFGVPPSTYMHSSAAIVVDGRFVMVGGSCEGCGTVWSSTDGRDWTLDLTVSPHADQVDVATDGHRVVVVTRACPDACETELATLADIWTSADGRTGWARSAQQLPIAYPRLAFAAGTFFAFGEAPNGVQIFTSIDGAEWTHIPRRDLPLGTGCRVASVAGSEDRVVVVGGGEPEACSGIWVSRVPFAP